MADHIEFIRESIIRDMSEGVMSIGMDGVITYVNEAAAAILKKKNKGYDGAKVYPLLF